MSGVRSSTRTPAPTRTRIPTPTRSGREGERGASSIEYVGAIGIVAALILAVCAAVVTTQPNIRDGALRAICEVFTLGRGDCGGGSEQAIDREPQEPCLVSSDGGELTISAGVIAFGEGGEIWLIEKLGDGTYRVTEGLGAAGGVEGGAGGKIEVTINDQKYGGEAGLSGAAKVGLAGGDIYTAQTLEEARDILAQLRYQRALDGAGPVGWIVDHVDGRDRLPEPDAVWIEAGVEAEGEASAEATVVNVAALASVEGAIGTEINRDGSVTVYLSGSVSGEGSAGIGLSLSGETQTSGDLDFTEVAAKAGISGEAGATVQVDYDAAGDVSAVRMISTLGWSGDLSAQFLGIGPDGSWGDTTDTTLELPIGSDADRAVAARALAALGIPYVPGLSDGIDLGNMRTDPIGSAADLFAFGEAAQDHGRVWIDTYDHDDTTLFGLEVEAALAGKVNLGGNYVTSSRETLGQRYWDGTAFVERQGCAA